MNLANRTVVLLVLCMFSFLGVDIFASASPSTAATLYPTSPFGQGSRACENRWYRFFHPRPGEFKSIAVGHNHACSIDSRGLLYCWGNGEKGQLGHSDCVGASSSKPIRSSGLNRYKKVVSGHSFSCALDRAGQAYCWGEGERGVLGDGKADPHIASFPQPVSGGHTFVDIVAGDRHVCAVDRQEFYYCWGDNSSGQLKADKDSVPFRSAPAGIQSSFGIRSIFAGGKTTCGRTNLEGLECWGELARYPEPRGASAPIRVQDVAMGSNHICMLTQKDNEAQCWGVGSDGRLGDGVVDDHYVKRPKKTLSESHFVQLAAGERHTCGIRTDRKAFCWGNNTKGQLGVGSSDTPAIATPSAVAFGDEFTSISTGGSRTCGITTENELFCWGEVSTDDAVYGKLQTPRPKKIYSFPLDRTDMNRYCQEVLSIDAVTTNANHPAALGHNINKDGLAIKGCSFMSPIPRDIADKKSPVLHELKRQMQGYLANYGSTGEYVCQFDISALTDEAKYIEPSKNWAVRCDERVTKKPYYARSFRLKPGQTAKIHSMTDLDRLLEPREGICAIVPERESGFVCEPNVCEDDKGQFFGAGDQYGEALPGKPRAVGTTCMSVECRVDENSGRYSERPVDISATWKWVKNDADKFICRAVDNGCYYDGKFYAENKLRIKPSEIHFTSEKNNTSCSFKELNYSCEKKPSEVFDWVLKSVQTVQGAREGQECKPIKGCVFEGAKYNKGQTVTENGPIRFSSNDEVTLCSYSRTTKTCEQRFEGSYYWKSTSFKDVTGFRSGSSCVEYQGCFFEGKAYKIGENRTRNGPPIFESDMDGAACRYELENFACKNQDGRIFWDLVGKTSIIGKKNGDLCAQIKGCLDAPSGQVVEMGQRLKKPSYTMGEGFNSPCSKSNSIYVCNKKQGVYKLEFEGTEAILERGWTFMPKNDPTKSCEQHKNCGDLIDGVNARHGDLYKLQPPWKIGICTYYDRKCEHGKGYSLTSYCEPRPHDDHDDD